MTCSSRGLSAVTWLKADDTYEAAPSLAPRGRGEISRGRRDGTYVELRRAALRDALGAQTEAQLGARGHERSLRYASGESTRTHRSLGGPGPARPPRGTRTGASSRLISVGALSFWRLVAASSSYWYGFCSDLRSERRSTASPEGGSSLSSPLGSSFLPSFLPSSLDALTCRRASWSPRPW